MLVEIVTRGKHDQKESHLGLHCLSKAFFWATSVENL